MNATVYTRYTETEAGCAIDLSDNTNLWGAPPSAARILRGMNAMDLARYPSAYSPDLTRAIAEYLSVDQSMIVAGCGSDDILDSAIRAFGRRDDLLVCCDPTFSMIPIFAAVSGLKVKVFSPADPDFPSRLLAESAEVVYLCSPNNPTGGVLDIDVIERIARESRGLVIVDEAYIDFGGSTALPLVLELGNVLVTRTFSKAFGLAGCRVGFGVAAPEVTQRIEAARGPYKITTTAERAVCAALANDRGWVEECVLKTVENRERFRRELSQIGLTALPGSANFLMIPVPDGQRFEKILRSAGIAVRRFSALTDIGDALRITIGPWEVLEQCVDALREISQ